MGLLSGPEIIRRIGTGDIVIDPFRESAVNPNSVNLRLSDRLLVYEFRLSDEYVTRGHGYVRQGYCLDMKKEHLVRELIIPEEGLVLEPNTLYLGSTMEYTETRGLVPCLEGRSSVGRLGLCVHVTAGFGDNLFSGDWTLELTTVHPLRIYAGVEVCQIAYSELTGEQTAYKGKYQGQRGPKPSGLWKDFLRQER